MENYRIYLAEYRKLETNRLSLRPIDLKDTEDMFEYSSDVENTYYIYPTHLTPKDTKFSIANYFMSEPLGKYGVELKEQGKLIGTIDLRIKPVQLSAEIGYVLSPSYQGKGYATEAAQAILDFAFEVLELEKVTATCNSENIESEALMLRLGMKKEGELRHHQIWKGGEWINLLQYGILRDEYISKRKATKKTTFK